MAVNCGVGRSRLDLPRLGFVLRMNFIFRSAVALIAAFTWLVVPAAAEKVDWRLTEATGIVRVLQPGMVPQPGRAGMALKVGSTITTGRQASAVVANGQQVIRISGDSRTTIAPDSGDGMTRILQDVGSAMFKVDRRADQHFRVETPLLAAVVKGTTFTVTAGVAEDVVNVSQGLVEVRALRSDLVRDLPAGQTVRIRHDNPTSFQVAAPTAGRPALENVQVPALDYAAVTNGVVQSSGPAAAGRSLSVTGAAAASNSPSSSGDAAGAAGGIGAAGSAHGGEAGVVPVTALAARASNGNGNGAGGRPGNPV